MVGRGNCCASEQLAHSTAHLHKSAHMAGKTEPQSNKLAKRTQSIDRIIFRRLLLLPVDYALFSVLVCRLSMVCGEAL